jgi:hypothetical protein
MSEQDNQHNEPNMVSDPSMVDAPNLSTMKTSIVNLVEKTEDQELLAAVYKILQGENKPLHLSAHIDKIFKQYPETLRKLAQ